MKVLSLGAGVQSTTVLLMSLEGEIPAYDLAIFADTQAEPRAVYDHLARLEIVARHQGTEVVRVTAGNLTAAILDPRRRDGLVVPVFIESAKGGSAAPLRRQCTEKFKSRPIYRWLNEHRDGAPVTLGMGISLDEVHRMKPAKRSWVTNEYPLVDARMDREACKRWMGAHGWTAPRSACTYCPYHSNHEWRRLRDEDPSGWAEAVRVDAEMRTVSDERHAAGTSELLGIPFVHRSLRPLPLVDLSTPEDHGQGELFGNECEGMCGV